MTFSTLEEAEQFARLLLRGRRGEPLLTLKSNPRGGVVVSGTWEDPFGTPVAVIEGNRIIRARSPAIDLVEDPNGVTFRLGGEVLWQIRVDDVLVVLEGLFFTNRGMLVLTSWGFVRWTERDALRVLQEAASLDPMALLRRQAASDLAGLSRRVH